MAGRTLSLAFELAGKLAPSFIESAKGATAQLKVVQKTAKEIQTKAEMRASMASWKNFTGSVKNAKGALGGVKSELVGIAKAAVGLVAGNGLLGASIYGAAKSSANYADAAIKNAQSVGMTADAFTELAYAANMSGVSQQEFVSSSAKLNRVVEDALSGSKSAMEAFFRAGVELRDSAGNLKTTEQLYAEIADTFAGMPDGIGKTSLAMELFGKSGAKLIPMLNSGRNGLTALRADAQRLGISLTDFDAKNAEAFNDSFANIGESIRGLTLIAGKHLWPVFTKIHDFISSKIVVAGQELARVMPQWTAEFEKGWDALVPELESAWQSIKDGARVANDFAQSMGGWVPLIKTAVKYWLYWRGIRLAKSLWDTGKAVRDLGRNFLALQYAGISIGGVLKAAGGGLAKAAVAAKAFGASLLLNPIGLAIAGIVALGGTIYLCVKYWDDITAAIAKAWEWIKGVFVAGWNMLPGWLQGPLASAYDSVAGFAGDVAGAFGGLWDKVAGYFTAKGAAVAAAFDKGILAGIWETLKQFNPLTLFMDAFTAVKDWLLNFDLASAGAALARSLGDGILNAWAGIKDSIKSAVVDWIPGGQSIANAASAAAGGIGDAAGWVGGKLSSLIPAFADGGVVTRPQLAMIGEAGPEVVVPVTRPGRAAELMQTAAGMMGRRGEAGGGGTTTYAVEFKPSITIQGNADASAINQIERHLRRIKDDIMRELDAKAHHQRRVGFSG